MKGDFSKFEFYPQATHQDLRTDNLTGVMHQQGRGLTDQDWNAGDQINRYLRQRQARDVIGANVVAVPADAAESFHISAASRVGDSVSITLQPGRVWVDGLPLVYAEVYNDSAPYTRNINYIGSPVQVPTASPDEIANGAIVRDAVVLEVWEESLNAFQDVEHLIEAALGGVDTTERVKVFHNISLYRLGPDDDCHSIARLLDDDFNNKGHLSISPNETVVIAGPCPVELGGGYSGFEHYLYRIEIASADAEGQAQFKWSRFNGGLVGRGSLNDDTVTLTANEQMINHCGLNSFYLEALQENTQNGRWDIVLSARASLDEGQLTLSGIQGTWPAGNDAFFRLWDGIERIERFSDELAEAREIEPGLGIRAAFNLPTADNRNYTEGDYWSFPVRAGGVHVDISQWPTDQPPYGVHYSRAPLAIIEWPANPPAQADSPGNIFDCRKVFQPLTQLDTCCSITVGNGTESRGDVDNIQAAINQLPAQGGVVCILSGVHYANVVIENSNNIIIRGCGKTTKIVPLIDNADDAVFSVTDSKCIVFEQMDIIAVDRSAFLLRGSEQGLLSDISIQHTRILACERAIDVRRGEHINIEQNKLRILDKEQGDVAIYMQAEDSLIERNEIIVIPFDETPPVDTPDDEEETDPTQPCFRIRVLIANPQRISVYWNQIWRLSLIALPAAPYRTQSGIQLAGSSERVQIRRNMIKGGAGNGITLGTAIPEEPPQEEENPNAETFTVRALNGIAGRVLNQDGSPAGDIVLSIVNEENMSFSTLSGSTSGEFFYSVDDNEYQIFITDTDYEITDITTQALGNRLFYNLVIKETEQEVDIDDELSGFIYDINIQANEITDMGLNGIGGPQLQNMINTAPIASSTPLLENTHLFLSARNRNAENAGERIAALFSSVIIGLHIQHNSIQNCLNRPFDTAMLAHARTSGMGGIALGWAEYAIIENNRIENNGRRHLDPVCGIVARGSTFTLRDNQIINNGPVLRSSASSAPLPGIRGGIALLAVSFSFSRFLSSSFRIADADNAGVISDDSMAAAIIHNNMVQQPAGPALMIIAYGPLQISDNRFSTEISAVSLGSQVFRNLGPVAISHAGVPDLSGLSSILRPALINARNGAQDTQALTGNPPSDPPPGIINTNLISGIRVNGETGELESAKFNRITPGATVLFNNNQSRLGVARGSIASQFIISNGDISFSANQSTVNIYDEELWFNTALDAETLRATGNRFMELSGRNSKRLQDAVQNPGSLSRSVMLIQDASMGIRVTDELVAGALNAALLKPFSLLSRTGRMNNTSHNQGDHCITALPLPGSLATIPTIADANQVALQGACTRYITQLDSLTTAAVETLPTQAVLSLLR